MDYYASNIQLLTDFFKSGCKDEKLLGLELEHFIVDKNGYSVSYYDGIEDLLKKIQPKIGEPIYSEGHLIGIIGPGLDITLEPAGQFETSIGPCKSLTCLLEYYNDFLDVINPVLAEMDFKIVSSGFHPKSSIEDMPMLPKKRYEYMYEYFNKSGTHGKYMMKGTAATQVSIDYKNEADFIKKYRVANILGPAFALICDNTKFFQGEPLNSFLFRTEVWNNVDPKRSMVVPGSLDKSFGFSDYAGYIYTMPPILLMKDNTAFSTGEATNAELFSGKLLTSEDVEHITTMTFPDVRLKKRIEIRTGDSLPFNEALAFTALIKGIFYSKENLDYYSSRLLDITNADVTHAKNELIKFGKDYSSACGKITDFTAELYNRALTALKDEASYLLPLKERCYA